MLKKKLVGGILKKGINFGKIQFFYDTVNFQNPVWVIFNTNGYLYMGNSLFQLAKLCLTEWNHDRHLVG